jgi:GGDEF domain-containing protein
LQQGPTGGSLSLFMVDVDFFKQYNDHYGTVGGDRCSNAYAALQAGLQRPGDVLARYGGEEFILLMEGLTRRCKPPRRAETLRQASMHWPNRMPSLAERRVTISMGVCTRRIEARAEMAGCSWTRRCRALPRRWVGATRWWRPTEFPSHRLQGNFFTLCTIQEQFIGNPC